MAGCLLSAVRDLSGLSDSQVSQVLNSESSQLEITKSLLSVLYNICLDRNIPLSPTLKSEFKRYNTEVVKLLQGASSKLNQTRDVVAKKKLLTKRPGLVRLISKACPKKLVE